MAMNKKEQAEFDAAKLALAQARALGWSLLPSPVKAPPPSHTEPGVRSISGWDFNTHTRQVTQMWSECSAHGSGPARIPYGSGSQRGIALYRTKRDALIGLRLALEQECAERLAKVDAAIAAEPTP